MQLLGSGTILREVIAAADLLREDWGVAADVWSCPSFTELAREAMDVERWNLLHPTRSRRRQLGRELPAGRGRAGGRRDRLHAAFADQIRAFVPGRYRVLGTDGFGRSDYRKKLRHFFEVDRHWVTLAALESLAKDGAVAGRARSPRRSGSTASIPEKPNPARV